MAKYFLVAFNVLSCGHNILSHGLNVLSCGSNILYIALMYYLTASIYYLIASICYSWPQYIIKSNLTAFNIVSCGPSILSHILKNNHHLSPQRLGTHLGAHIFLLKPEMKAVIETFMFSAVYRSTRGCGRYRWNTTYMTSDDIPLNYIVLERKMMMAQKTAHSSPIADPCKNRVCRQTRGDINVFR